jgi:hypothetical protein
LKDQKLGDLIQNKNDDGHAEDRGQGRSSVRV